MDELQRYLVEEAVEDYEEGRLTRREALKAIAGITGAALAAQMLEARAQTPPAGKSLANSAPLVAPDDPSIVAGIAEFPGEGVRLSGYLARPAGTVRHAVVLVCHENRGLTRHIEDVARRVAKAGYVGLRARSGPALARRRDRQARVRRDSRDPRQGGPRTPRAGFQEWARVCKVAAQRAS